MLSFRGAERADDSLAEQRDVVGLARCDEIPVHDAGLSTYIPPAFLTSIAIDGQQVRVRPRRTSAEMSTCGPWQIAATIPERLGAAYLTQDWTGMNRSLFSALLLEKYAIAITIGLIVMVAALNIVASLVLLVMEKHRDIAILKTMGCSPRRVRNIFVLQGFIIGLMVFQGSVFNPYFWTSQLIMFSIIGSIFFYSLRINRRNAFAVLLVLFVVQVGLLFRTFKTSAWPNWPKRSTPPRSYPPGRWSQAWGQRPGGSRPEARADSVR
jgi:hypothetical protein